MRAMIIDVYRLFCLVLIVALLAAPLNAQTTMPGIQLTDQQVAQFARLALDGIPREYPNKPANVMTGPASVLSPREMHPVFFGCFDWHSSVHGHWMLVRLAKTHGEAPVVSEIRTLLDEQLTADKLAKEAAYFDEQENHSFERMYGWAWTLRLATELKAWGDSDAENDDARRWAKNLRPLEERIVELTKGYLPRLSHPIRTGVHPDTAFALGQALDYARTVGDQDLAQQIIAYARDKYLADRDYPARYEPSGEDFFSPAWNEADLMRRVLPAKEFAAWLDAFLPGLAAEDSAAATLLTPVAVTDVTDGKLVHLAGLNLSRAWCQQGVLAALRSDDPRRDALERSLAAHTKAGVDYVFSGHYEGEHWLATFAVYLLTEAGTTPAARP